MSPVTINSAGAPAKSGPGIPIETLPDLSFVVVIPGHEIGRFGECSGLAVEYDVLEYAEGGNNLQVHQLRGRVRYPNVVLRRGVTHEDELLNWFFATEQPAQRPTVTITLNDATGTVVRQFALSEAQPVRWTGPTASSTGHGPASESLEIAHAGFV
jgi:phage tail-like protein